MIVLWFFSLLLLQNDPIFRFQNYRVDDGLSQNTVHAIAQDKYGFIWIGTEDKLNRFDGQSFDVFQNIPFDTTSLSQNYITALHFDLNNQLWVGAFNELNAFDERTERFIRFRTPYTNSNYFRIYDILDYEKLLFVSTSRGLFYKGLDLTSPLKRISSIGKKNISSLIKKNADELLFCAGNNVLYSYHIKSERLDSIQFPSDVKFQKLYLDHEGQLWAGLSENRVIRVGLNGEIVAFQLPVRSYHNTNTISSFTEDETYVWVGTEFNSVHLISKKGTNVVSIKEENKKTNGLKTYKIKTLFTDKSGIKWIGTDGEGVCMYNPSALQICNIPIQSEKATMLWGMSTDRKDLFVGTSYNITQLQSFSRPKQLIPTPFEVYSVLVDKDKLVFGGLYSNLFQYSFDTKSLKQLTHFNYGKSVFQIKKMGDEYWYSTEVGLVRYNINSSDAEYVELVCKKGNSLSYMVNDFEFDSRNDSVLWIATRFSLSGLIKYNIYSKVIEKIYEYNSNDMAHSLSSNEVFTVYNDEAHDLIWIGTKSGLDILDTKKDMISHFYTRDGLPNNTIYTIMKDDFNSYWVSTNYGLSNISLEEENPPQLSFRNYSKAHGLINLEYNQNSFFKDSLGRLYFGGNNGIDIIYPERKDVYTASDPIVIKRLETGCSTYFFPKEKLYLSEPKKVKIMFSKINYSEHTNYSFLLEGDETFSGRIGEQTWVEFVNLSPGEYVFTVSSLDDSSLKTELHFFIPPPFYATFWFRIVCGFLLLVCTLAYVYRQNRMQKLLERRISERTQELECTVEELKETTELKNLLMNTVIHDMKNPLNSILLISQNEVFGEAREKIFFYGQQLLNISLDLLDTHRFEAGAYKLEKEYVCLFDIVQKALTHTEYLAKQRGIDVYSDVSASIYVICDHNLIRRVLINLITNALKFSKEGCRVEISACVLQSDVQLSIKDEGEGIPKERLEHIFNRFEHQKSKHFGFSRSTGIGLTFCKFALEMHQKTIDVHSELGKGSTFSFRLEHIPQSATFAIGSSYIERLKQLDVHDASEVYQVIDALKTSETYDEKCVGLELERIFYSGNQTIFETFIHDKISNFNR